jgi:hypothetical protein
MVELQHPVRLKILVRIFQIFLYIIKNDWNERIFSIAPGINKDWKIKLKSSSEKKTSNNGITLPTII